MADNDAAPKQQDSGNILTRKFGPLPAWAWGALAVSALLIYEYRKKENAQQTVTSATTQTTSAQIPQFVNQTYTTVSPPQAPTPGTTTIVNNIPPASSATTPPARSGSKPVGKSNPKQANPNANWQSKPAGTTLPSYKPGLVNLVYVVKPGDNLWDLSDRYFGAGKYWGYIYNDNKSTIGPNPNLIHPGQKLLIEGVPKAKAKV